MVRRTRGGGHYQYLSNTGFSNGFTMPKVTGYLRGWETALANPTPWTKTMTGGRRCGCKPKKTRAKLVWAKSRRHKK